MDHKLYKITATIFHDGAMLVKFFRKDGCAYRTYYVNNTHWVGKVLEDLSYRLNSVCHFQVDKSSTFVSVKFDDFE